MRQSENTSSHVADRDVESRVVRAVQEYLALAESRANVQREEFIARFPDIAESLKDCIDAVDLVQANIPNFSQDSQADEVEDEAASSFVRRTLGDFRILDEVGRGGMGVVYEADQLSLGRRVALKVLPFAAVLDPRSLKRFKNEALAAASLEHPNIVGVYSVGCDRGVHFYAMRFIEGHSLAEVIRQLKSHADQLNELGRSSRQARDIELDSDVVRQFSSQHSSNRKAFHRMIATIGIQVAEALEAAHQVGIVHRDVKPANLLLDNNQKVWVTDFGLAQTTRNTELTLSGDMVGTLRYMSPEQVSSERYVLDHRTDIYSLGLSLYELLTLHAAYSGSDVQKLIRQIADQPPIRPRKLDATISRELETVILKAIEKEPTERYETAQAMADDLRRVLEYRPLQARRTGRCRRSWQWCRRNPSISVLLACVTSLLVCLTLGSSYFAMSQAKLFREADRRNYVLSINTGTQAIQESNLAHLRQLLVPFHNDPDYKNRFEMRLLLANLERADAAPTFDHACEVNQAVFSSDEKTLVTGGADGVVRFWDVRTNTHRELPAHQGRIEDLALSGNGRLLLTAGFDGFVRLWHAEEREQLWEHQVDWRALSVAITQDGGLLAWDSMSKICVVTVDAGTSQPSHPHVSIPAHRMGATDLSFSRDGSMLASTGRDYNLHVWRVHRSDQHVSLELLRKHTHFSPLMAVAFSADGKYVAAGGWHDQTMVWAMPTWELVSIMHEHGHSSTSLCFAPDDRTLLSSSLRGDVIAWDIVSSEMRDRIPGHEGAINAIDVSGDAELAVTASRDHTAKLWHLDMRQRKGLSAFLSTQIAIVDDGTKLVVGGGFIHPQSVSQESRYGGAIYNLSSGDRRALLTPDFNIRSIAVSPTRNALSQKGAVVAIGGALTLDQAESGAKAVPSQVRFWCSTSSHELNCSVDPHLVGLVDFLAFSPDGSALAISTNTGQLILWDLDQSRPRWQSDLGFSDTDFDIYTLAITPDGHELWVGVSGGQNPTGLRYGGQIRRHSMHDGRTIGLPLKAHDEIVTSIAFSRDQTRYATASLDDKVKIWDLKSKKELAQINAHERPTAVAFSKDGQTLVSCGGDGTVKFWETTSGEQLASIPQFPTPVSLAFSEDGDTLAIGRADGSVGVWHVNQARHSWPKNLD